MLFYNLHPQTSMAQKTKYFQGKTSFFNRQNVKSTYDHIKKN